MRLLLLLTLCFLSIITEAAFAETGDPAVASMDATNELRKEAEAKYKSCMSVPMQDLPDNVDQKEYCECYTRKWTENFKNYTGTLSDPVRGWLQTQASGYCDDHLRRY